VTFWEAMLLVVGGIAAGTINTMAGGGSLLTVPLLVLAGVPGNVANGSNRVGVLTSSLVATWSFRRQGLYVVRRAVPVLVPVVAGSIIGAAVVGQLADETFETIFGVLMIPLLVVSFWPRSTRVDAAEQFGATGSSIMFFLVGLYGGAFQAGVGLLLVAALSRSGVDLVNANAVKVVITVALALSALPVFIVNDQVAWGPALVLAAGFGAGGFVGARLTVKGGERLLRPVLLLAVVALSGRLVGWW
jgi:uncharacterized membrane protein YfcA